MTSLVFLISAVPPPLVPLAARLPEVPVRAWPFNKRGIHTRGLCSRHSCQTIGTIGQPRQGEVTLSAFVETSTFVLGCDDRVKFDGRRNSDDNMHVIT